MVALRVDFGVGSTVASSVPVAAVVKVAWTDMHSAAQKVEKMAAV